MSIEKRKPEVYPAAWISATDTTTEARVVLNGLAYGDLVRAVEDARPWVEVPSTGGIPAGTRLPVEWVQGVDNEVIFVHPDDVPDPDADLIEAMAKVLLTTDDDPESYATWAEADEHAREFYCNQARAVLAVVRENEAQR